MTAPRVLVRCVGPEFQPVFGTGKSSLETVTATALKASPPRRPASPNTSALFPSEIFIALQTFSIFLRHLREVTHAPMMMTVTPSSGISPGGGRGDREGGGTPSGVLTQG